MDRGATELEIRTRHQTFSLQLMQEYSESKDKHAMHFNLVSAIVMICALPLPASICREDVLEQSTIIQKIKMESGTAYYNT